LNPRKKKEGMEAEPKRTKTRKAKKKVLLYPAQKKTQPGPPGWLKGLGLVRATPWDDFADIDDEL